MKKIFFFTVYIFAITEVIAQNFTQMKSPDVKAYLNANYLPVNESTGKVDITIPIYVIDLDGLSIPISLSYNTGGVKVNSSASKVGLNWNLNAGGFVSKEIKGVSDIDVSLKLSDQDGPGHVYTSYGYLRHLLTWSTASGDNTISQPYRDTQPDLFRVMAPGLFTKFTHKSTGEPFELDKSETIIKSPFNNSSYLHDMYFRHKLKSGFSFELTPRNGFEYSFSEVEFSASAPKRHGNSAIHGTMYALEGEYPGVDAGSPIDFWYYTAIPNGLVSSPLPLNTTEQEIEDGFFSPGIYYVPKGFISDIYPTVHLSYIKSPFSKRKVTYHYSNNYIIDNDRRVERNYQGTTKVGQVNYEHDYTREKILNKIIFPDGQINFYYESNRLDVRGGKILKKIEIRNNKGLLVKAVILEQDYFTSLENCNENHCKRLRLNAVKFIDKNNNVLPGYSFKYNSTKLPKRFSIEQDYTGYYNGQSGFSEEVYLPKFYFKANQGKKSYLPFPQSGYSLVSGTNASLLPNLTYSKAASLEKIIYPTGGYSTFEYELHSFSFLNETKQSGGLRVKSQSIYESNNILEKKMSYDYILENGSTSGSIGNLPVFFSFNYSLGGSISRNLQVSNTELQLTKNSYVSYSRVKVSEQNNGYIINEYSSFKDFPNEYPLTNLSETDDLFVSNYNNGLHPTIFRDYSRRRGELLSSKVYDQQNILLRSITNEYDYKIYDSFSVSENVIFGQANFKYTNGNNARYAQFSVSLTSEGNDLVKTITNEHTSKGIISNEKIFIHHSSKALLKEIQESTSDGNVRQVKYAYPFDSDVSGMPYISNLENLNILSPVKTTVLKNNSVLETSLTEYENYGSNMILPKNTKTSMGTNSLDIENEFHRYDERGNLVEYSKKDGVHVAILWGHNYQAKIAEIVGGTYTEALEVLSMSNIDGLQNLSDNELRAELNKLRDNLPDAQVYSYIQTPLVGVAEIIDPNGNKNTFKYDAFNRLESIEDNDNNIVSEYAYNYKLKPLAGNVLQENLTLEIIIKPTDFYVPVASALNHETLLYADVRGGKGDYMYEWTLEGSSSVLSTLANYTVSIPCGGSTTLKVTITDDNNIQITKYVTIKAAKCGEPFYVGQIEGSSTANNQNNFWIDAEGGSYNFKYGWFIPGGPGASDAWGYDNHYNRASSLLRNTSGEPVTVNLNVRVTDVKSGFYVVRSRTVVIQPEFEISSCFIAGTKIKMADGAVKNIEEVKIGDQILTYNVETSKIEIGEVEETVSPIHFEMIEVAFGNDTQTISTYDHPYYVKGKGWASFDPALTDRNYQLKVSQMEVGDIAHVYDATSNKLKEVKIEKINKQEGEVQTYNLSRVSKNHNFFANGILVHNKTLID